MRIVCFFILVICFLLIQCTAKKTTEYNIPTDVGQANRAILIERFEKGKILYINTCSACHGIYTKGKDSVTNFTNQQIDNYTKIALANPKNHAVLRKISPEQFDYIITFLRLRRPGEKDLNHSNARELKCKKKFPENKTRQRCNFVTYNCFGE